MRLEWDESATREELRELKPMWSPTFKVRAWFFGSYGTLLLLYQALGLFPERWSGLARQLIAFLSLALLAGGAFALWRAWRGPRLWLAVGPRLLRAGETVRLVYAFDERGAGGLRALTLDIEQRRYRGLAGKSTFDRSTMHDAPFDRLVEHTLLELEGSLQAAGEATLQLPSDLHRTHRFPRAWVGTLLFVRAEFARGPRLEQEFELILHRSRDEQDPS